MTEQDINLLIHGASSYGLSLDTPAIDRFRRYVSLLETWSHRTNLVSKKDLGRLVTYHFLDSLKIASCVSFESNARILDFGSGAGFPGIPLAIAFPEASVYLVESRTKRCTFLNETVAELGLSNVRVACSRIEVLNAELEHSFDCVFTRATVALDMFFSLAAKFLKRGGSLAAIKGEHIDKEYSLLESHIDPKVFNIFRTRPVSVPDVRDGWVVVVRSI